MRLEEVGAGPTTHFQDSQGTTGPRGRDTGHWSQGSAQAPEKSRMATGNCTSHGRQRRRVVPKPHVEPPWRPPFGSPGLTERLRECSLVERQSSRAGAGGHSRCGGSGCSWTDTLAGVVLHHLPRHLRQDTLG